MSHKKKKLIFMNIETIFLPLLLFRKLHYIELEVIQNRVSDSFESEVRGLQLGISVVAHSFKVGRSPSKEICFIYFNESPLKMMKNAFYVVLNFLFVLKIFKVLS